MNCFRTLTIAAVLAAATVGTTRAQSTSPDYAAVVAQARASLDSQCEGMRGKPWGTDEIIAKCKERFAALSDQGALNQNIHNLSLEIAKSKRKELHDYYRECMPRGDCDEEYAHGLAEEATQADFDARTH